MSENTATEVCPVCGVEIINGRIVKFSSGPTGDRKRLYARVCRYIQDDRKTQCLNQEEVRAEEVTARDAYGDGKDVQFPNFGRPPEAP